MHLAGTNHRTKVVWNSSDAGPRYGSPKLAAATLRRALTLAVLSALLLIAAYPAQAQETVLYNFTGGLGGAPPGDGAYPQSSLTSDGADNFYGTTGGGGAFGSGTVFELSPNGSGGWNETVIYSFCSAPNCADGASPAYSYVIFDSVGNLYGTTSGGGSNGQGVVFELSPVGTSWTETVLHSFTGWAGGGQPVNGLIFDRAGNLYGTTYWGGDDDAAVAEGTCNPQCGTVFELSPSGDGWTEQVIYAVASSDAGLTMDSAGNIFGVSTSTVFEL